MSPDEGETNMMIDPNRFLLAFFEAILRRPEYATACDVALDLSEKYNDGGKKAGRLIRSLEQDGLIKKVATTKSRRRSRKGGLLHAWAAIDIALIRIRRDAIAAGLNAPQIERPVTQRTLPGFD